jgi:hypothetical protein
MGVHGAKVVVSTTPVALNTATVGGQRLTINNRDATNAVDLGGSSVAAGAGYSLPALTKEVFQLNSGEILYAVRTGGSNVTLDVLRSGV